MRRRGIPGGSGDGCMDADAGYKGQPFGSRGKGMRCMEAWRNRGGAAPGASGNAQTSYNATGRRWQNNVMCKGMGGAHRHGCRELARLICGNRYGWQNKRPKLSPDRSKDWAVASITRQPEPATGANHCPSTPQRRTLVQHATCAPMLRRRQHYAYLLGSCAHTRVSALSHR